MKYGLFILLLSLSVSCYSQKEVTAYIEIKGRVDILGGVDMSPVTPPRHPANLIDSLIDYGDINAVFSKKNNTSISIFNALSLKGWTLFAVSHALTDNDKIPSAFVLYYFKRGYVLAENR